MNRSPSFIQRVLAAFADLDLGDPRRDRRLKQVITRMAKHPGASLPNALETEAELEGAYRLVNNEDVDPQDLFLSVATTTAERARAAGSVLVIHDTTTCGFAHAPAAEVGYLSTGEPGFYLHTALVLDANGWRRPLGVVQVETIVRKQRSKRGRKRKASGAETARWKDRESQRWDRGVVQSELALAGCRQVCHIADREGDSYAFLGAMVRRGCSFVVRVNHDRKVGDPDDLTQQWLPLKERVRGLEGMLEREVMLSARQGSSAPRASRSHPSRRARPARLKFTATSVVLRRPRYLEDPIPATLTLNVVHVSEPQPPPDEPAVEWLLFTTLPCDTESQVATVVDAYRSRWTTEEFYKALKTGCVYESREFQSLHALLVILAMTLPIAVELLWMRSRAREQPNAPATEILTGRQLEILRTLGSRPIPTPPTARAALWAVAGLGGHQKNNGDPGWLVLHRGMVKLLAYEAAWEVGFAAGRKDRQP
jgi:hypothetical protein